MAFLSPVLDQDGLDRVDRPDVMPFTTATQCGGRFIWAVVVAFDDPVRHQYHLAVSEADCFGIATDNLGKQAT